MLPRHGFAFLARTIPAAVGRTAEPQGTTLAGKPLGKRKVAAMVPTMAGQSCCANPRQRNSCWFLRALPGQPGLWDRGHGAWGRRGATENVTIRLAGRRQSRGTASTRQHGAPVADAAGTVERLADGNRRDAGLRSLAGLRSSRRETRQHPVRPARDGVLERLWDRQGIPTNGRCSNHAGADRDEADVGHGGLHGSFFSPNVGDQWAAGVDDPSEIDLLRRAHPQRPKSTKSMQKQVNTPRQKDEKPPPDDKKVDGIGRPPAGKPAPPSHEVAVTNQISVERQPGRRLITRATNEAWHTGSEGIPLAPQAMHPRETTQR